MKIDMTEFVMLAGTELAVNMIRNRIVVPADILDSVLDFVEEYATGLYHFRRDPNIADYIYFESHIDKDNTISFCQKISPTLPESDKYH